MHFLEFLTVVAPTLTIIYFSSIELGILSLSDHDDWHRYVIASFVCQLIVMVYRIACVVRGQFLQHGMDRRKLPESPSTSTEQKFVAHILEEAIKASVLYIYATVFADGPAKMASYVVLASAVFAGNKLVCTLFTYSPLNYESHYAKFTSSLRKFESRCCLNSDRSTLASEPAILVLQSSDETANPLFKLDLFESLSNSPIDIPASGSAQAHLYKIDRLYSVSPKDTMYPSYEHYLEDCECEGASQQAQSVKIDERSCNGRLIDSRDLKTTQYPVTAVKECVSIGDSPLLSAASYTSSVKAGPEKSSWAWIFPWCNNEVSQENVSRNVERAMLRKKLSTFTLNSEKLANGLCETSSLKSWSRSLYGTLDLECQLARLQIPNSHTFHEYARFANKYLDSWSPNVQGVLRCIDPAFIKFGIPIPRLPAFYFTLYASSACLWQFSSMIVLALPFMGLVPPTFAFLAIVTLIVAKLFCVNYLHGQCTLSYKFSICAEFALNVVVFSLAYASFHFSVIWH